MVSNALDKSMRIAPVALPPSDVIVNYLYFKIVLLLLLITFEVNESLAVILSIQICSRSYRFYSTVD